MLMIEPTTQIAHAHTHHQKISDPKTMNICSHNIHRIHWQAHPFYAGVASGWGTTDWRQITATQNDYILSLSTPIRATDKGFVYGFVMGYEITPLFAFEINYMRFPTSRVQFDPFSLYAFEDHITSIHSFTYTYNFIGKFMAQVQGTGLRGFANAGPAVIHRHDALAQSGHIAPTFGVGIDYVIEKRYMLELLFQYYAGYGKAVLKPAINYIPFLYTLHIKIMYRF